ncbi:MAG: histidine phosphatase family protein [Pseudomonadota bacterium]
MRQLFLVRHAQAESGAAGQSDFDRVLTAKGRGDAADAGFFLKDKNFFPDKILVSPAKRTRETFALLKNAFSHEAQVIFDEDIYNASFDTLQQLIASADEDVQRLMIVGHNPGMHTIAMYYAAANTSVASFSPATVCVLEFKNSWHELPRRSGAIIALHMPETE